MMMNVRSKNRDERMEWFPCFPRELLNALGGMPADHKLVYLIVLLRIYEVGGPIHDNARALAVRCGLPVKRTEAALQALVEDGKIADLNGLLFNDVAAEIIADQAERKDVRKKAASAGGFAKAKKHHENQQNGAADAVLMPAQLQEQVHKEEKKDFKPRVAKPPRAAGVAYSEEFESRVWGPYPRKASTSKKNAWLKWLRLSADQQAQVIRAIPLYAAQMRREGRTEDKIKHLEFFISGEIYATVGAAAASAGPPRRPIAEATREDWQKMLGIWRSTDNWRETWGPAPGRAGCLVPVDLLEQFMPAL